MIVSTIGCLPFKYVVAKMSDQPPVAMGRVFRYTTIACEVLVFALVGYVIGPYIFGPGGEILGALIGAIIGTFMMFCTLFYLAGMFERKQDQPSASKKPTGDV
jgi:uncharacterized membrane protein